MIAAKETHTNIFDNNCTAYTQFIVHIMRDEKIQASQYSYIQLFMF